MPVSDPPLGYEERRTHPRVTLKAFGYNHVCRFTRSDRRHQANLVDVSSGGARLALLDDRPPIAVDDILIMDLGLSSPLQDLAAVPATVRWTGAGDFGISFARELDLGNSELQRLLTK